MNQKTSHDPLSRAEYDAQGRELGDFVRYNPGARHRRRLWLYQKPPA